MAVAKATRIRPPPRPSPLGLVAGMGRQLEREWRAGPIHGLAIAGPKPRGLASRPRDPRPTSLEAGQQLVAGEFRLVGEILDVGLDGDPWDRPCPSQAFAAALHGFGWMGDLLATGEGGAQEALRLWLGWLRLFDRAGAFGWTGEVLERRVFNQACAAATVLPLASDAEVAFLAGELARQARHLLSDPGDPSRALERAVAAALVGAALVGKAGDGLLRPAMQRIERLAPEAVLPDGVHASRSPERGMELLFDLAALDDALSQRGAPAPVEAARALDRLSGAVRFFTLADHRLARFHGGDAGARERVDAVVSLEAERAEAMTAAPYGGYHRLQSRQIQLIADVAAPAASGCAQPGAIDVAVGGRRLLIGSSWSAKAGPGEGAARGPAGGSCLSLGGIWPETVEIKSERRETEDGVWLDIEHEGWRRAFGLTHTRRLFLDLAGDELRGEDQLTPAGKARGDRSVDYAVRFLVSPRTSVQVAADGRSALLRPATGAGWRLRSDAARMVLAPGVVLEEGQTRHTHVLVLAGQVRSGEGGRVRWKLSRDEAG
jgi:uncharacterized heparinase superfamily protein